MSRRTTTPILLLSLLLFAGCKGGPRAKPNRHSFNPPISGANDVLQCDIRKVELKRFRGKPDSLRVWIKLKNLSEQTLRVSYGNMTATADDGRTGSGMLYVFMGAGTTNSFPIRPGDTKNVSQPIDFRDFGDVDRFDFGIENIRVDGEEGSSELTIPVTLRELTESAEGTGSADKKESK